MPTEVLQKGGTPVVFADTTDYSATNSGYTRTAQIDLTSLANGAAQESDKVDLGATRAAEYDVIVNAEIDAAPTAGSTSVRVYWSGSPSATAGTGNDGGAAGVDGAYKASEVEEWVKQLLPLGQLMMTADAAPVVQRGTIGRFSPPQRYGSVIVVNSSGQAFEGDAVEMCIALVPVVDEIQD